MTDKLTKSEASKLQDGIKRALRTAGQGFVEAAVQLDTFKKGRGWLALGYDTMTEWRTKEIQSTEFYNLRDVSKLLEVGVSAEVVGQMPISNIQTLVHRLPRSIWLQESWQRNAIEMSVATFEKAATTSSEERGMHVEEMERRGFVLPISLAKQWDETMRIIETLEDIRMMEQKVELLITEYLNGLSKIAGVSRVQRYGQIKRGENI